VIRLEKVVPSCYLPFTHGIETSQNDPSNNAIGGGAAAARLDAGSGAGSGTRISKRTHGGSG